jgi:stalled ribosome rescue protein Dom34
MHINLRQSAVQFSSENHQQLKFAGSQKDLFANSHKSLFYNDVCADKSLVAKVKRKSRYRRGYPVALLVGFEDDHAMLWRIFSRVVKLSHRLQVEGKRTDEKALYNFHESVVNAIKPVLKEGVRTIVVSAPPRTTYAQDFLQHVQKHHRYLMQPKNPNCANFAELVGSADDRSKVAELVKNKQFTKQIAETTSEEADRIVNVLEKHLYRSGDGTVVLYALKEIEDIIYDRNKKDDFVNAYLLLTDQYLAGSKNKNRIHRLLQIAQNKKVKTRIVNAETAAGSRISQFGGIVFFSATNR